MLKRIQVALYIMAGLLAACPEAVSSSRQRESIDALARRYGFGAPLRMGMERVLRSKYSTVVFTSNSRKLRFNNTLIWLNDAVRSNSDGWTLNRYDSQAILDPLLRPSATVRGDDVVTVVLDPGHGGADSGAIGHRRVFEKKAVLDIGKRTRDILKTQGIVVRMTRKRDTYLSLSRRSRLARRWGADLFVSIHFNACDNARVSGIETFICSSPGFPSTAGGRANAQVYRGNHYDKKNTLLAYYLHRGMLQQVKAIDRGIKHARFQVLRDAPCPTVLLECGFISNHTEAARVIDRRHRTSLARGIANGIVSYIAKTRRRP